MTVSLRLNNATPFLLFQSYGKVPEQSNSRYSDEGYTTRTFVINGKHFSPVSAIDDEFHHTIPPPLHATTYGPPRPVLFNSFRNKQPFYNHRFGPARANVPHAFGFQPKDIFKPANQEPAAKYNQHVDHEPHLKTGPQVFHTPETYAPDSYTPDAGYSPDYTYGLPEKESQREHEIPSVRVNVDHSKNPREPFPGNRFYQDSFFDIKPKNAGDSVKHNDKEDDSSEHGDEDTSKQDYDVGTYGKYAPRLQNYIPPSYNIVKQYLPLAKGITKSYFPNGFIRIPYVQKFDDSYLQPNPPNPHLQPYYKRPLPIHQTQIPQKTHYDGPTNGFGYSDNLGFSDLDDYFGHYPEEKSASVKDRFSTSSSDWTPINAPDGAVPAKSYDIPAPDLSKGHPDKVFRRGTEDHSIVVGKNKQPGKKNQKIQGNSEGVVSAVVRVKQ